MSSAAIFVWRLTVKFLSSQQPSRVKISVAVIQLLVLSLLEFRNVFFRCNVGVDVFVFS